MKTTPTLLLATLLVANLAVEGAKLIPPAHAATRTHYKVVPYTDANREEVLNRYAEDGWELSAVDTKSGAFILKRE